VLGSAHVQHAGTWLCLGLLEAHGLHRALAQTRREAGVSAERLRVATEALAAALCLGEGCAEGVRRLATPTAPLLLRTPSMPSEEWVRDTFRALAKAGAVRAHLGLAGHYLASAKARGGDEATLFYVDNHLRPYTGQHVIRKGWRMQDKAVVPGTTDYWVHDADGRPVFRVDVPAHDSLCEWLQPIAKTIRLALGRDERILLAFDRAGAFPDALSQLRDLGIEFVTYERRPYPALPASAFTQTAELDGETLRYTEARINLGKGRGRLRRISVVGDDGGEHINLLCGELTDAVRAIAAMRGRWRQENGFKHGVERWGFNQLDARKVEAYDPEAVIPNPARRRLERAFRVACIAEGDLRRKLADLGVDDPRRAKLDAALIETVEHRRLLDQQRASVPRHAPVKETELAGSLRRHLGTYKALIDTVRIACANIEADLAAVLAEHLPRPAEAKKTLAVLFAAPGRVRVGTRTIAITLAPAGSPAEHEAYGHFWKAVNRLNLALPGDPRRRRLRFHSST
jgi:hypothetical protein